MSVYYYKGAQILAPLTIVSNEPMFDVDTVSLKKQRASQDVQRWELTFSTIGEPSTQAEMLISSVVGIESTDTMVMPQLPSIDSGNTLSVSGADLNAAANAGDTTIYLDNDVQTGKALKGTFVKFSNHDKLYMLTNDVDFDLGGGNVTVNLYPKLRTSLATTDSMRFGSDVVLTYYTSIDNQTGITFTDGVLSNAGSISLIEAL